MTEADFQTEFGRWVRSDAARDWIGSGSCAFELKLARGLTLPFSRVEAHQLEALRRAKGTAGKVGLFHKISDMAAGFKPLDCVYVAHAGAWLVVRYLGDERARLMYLVDVEAYSELVEGKGGRGSMGRDEARRIGMEVAY